MHAPHISTDTWWLIAAAATAVSLAVCVPLMPTAGAKKIMAILPAFFALIAVLTAISRHPLTLDQTLGLYSASILIPPLGMAGHRKELQKMARKTRLFGDTSLPSMNFCMQMCTAVVLMLGTWVAWCMHT
ncbi:hypothetical protein SSP35_09_00690 [Streptomyces sp. NBRC 110611]|uniref:hypothetical protein n=1 Tax=Streptomyces sp. NBRC 110611 TaxID=1621259 RepID=UPI0008353A28|nr:hypothetical protein [Streptomyces sp. NBRC 110611]GAU68826.1 hypothetical protein SSP35_09_00690 [Streptomyces sp. NBRC 110611]